MSNMVNFSKIIPLLETDEDFSITESQYLKNTGKEMPKDTYYLKNAPHYRDWSRNMVFNWKFTNAS